MDYALHLVVLVLIWATLGLSQGFQSGYLGILAVHQASAWALGAYVAALLDRTWDVPLAVAVLPSALCAGGAMMLLTALVSRGAKDEQVIVSLCIQMIVIGLLTNLAGLTNGPLGLAGIGDEALSQTARVWSTVAWSSLILTGVAVTYGVLARTGARVRWLLARDDRDLAESLGFNTANARVIAACLAGASAGAIGAVYAHYLTFIDPGSFALAHSVAILAIATVGRAPSVPGVIAAAALLVLAPEAFRVIGLDAALAANIRQALFGLVLVAAIAAARRP
jgi:branched-chain amino acid transport system permease protein